MEYLQYEYLREGVTMSRNTTYQEDLPENGLLTSMLIRMSAAGVSGAFAAVHKWRISDFIDKIEIIGNGSEVIKSLTGNCLQGIMEIDNGGFPIDYWQSYATGTKRFHVMLTFGRQLFDKLYGLDLSKWDNVQIKITNSATSTQLGEDISLSMLCFYWRGDITSFAGYIRTEEWRKWDTVSNEIKYLEMPTEHLIRRILMQVYPDQDANFLDESNMFNYAWDVELSLKTGQLRVFKGGTDDLARLNAIQMKNLAYSFPNYYCTADKGRYVGIGYVLGSALAPGSKSGTTPAVIPGIENNSSNSTQKPEVYTADEPFGAIHAGYCPENMLFLPFNFTDDLNGYLDPKENEAVKLNIQTRSGASYADGEIRIVLERLVLR